MSLFTFWKKPQAPPHDVLFVYKNMADNRQIMSHTGLGVTAMNISKNLQADGISVDIEPVFDGYELRDKVLVQKPRTHVVLFAPWVDTPFLQGLIRKYPKTAFAITCHSNVGFLQADKYAVKLIREQMELELINNNYHLAANSERLVSAIQKSFKMPAAWLPNMYAMPDQQPAAPKYNPGDKLKIGIFGAMRPQKNMLTAAWAGLQIARTLNVRCEVAINSGRVEGGQSVLGAIRELLTGLPDVTLNEAGWMSWPQFRGFIKSQHLLLSPSYTESFCNVTADGIAEGVPSVVSPAIPWAPESWKADPDDVNSIATVGLQLLADKNAAKRGYKALQEHNKQALKAWKRYLDGSVVR